MKILVVDDDPSNRLLLRSVLEDLGHDVREESCFERATWNTDEIELAIVDGNFPQRPGRKPTPCGPILCAILRDRGIKTILVSGDQELVDDELWSGFPALVKGCKLDELRAAIEMAEVGAK